MVLSGKLTQTVTAILIPKQNLSAKTISYGNSDYVAIDTRKSL